jgi:3-hydroxy-9,10-secoandrosta-1,3,5(10)-triene-9,17-dione monooxygenase reductase component
MDIRVATVRRPGDRRSRHDEILRAALRSVTQPVVVVTGLGASGPVGLTVSSFASVSADPPLVLFCPSLVSHTWAEMAPSGRFAVHVLGRDQVDLALRFADRGDRFAGTAWTDAEGLPVLDGALAVLLCRMQTRRSTGDHEVVVGLVERTLLLREGTGLDSHRVHEARFAGGTTAASAHQTRIHRPPRSGRPGVDPQLGEDVADVSVGSPLADEQRLGHLPVRQAVCE